MMNTWIGKTKDDLTKSLGQPTRVVDNGKDGTIMMYSAMVEVRAAPSSSITVTTTGDGYTGPEAKPAAPQDNKSYLKFKMFYVNTSGVIYSWKIMSM